MTMTPSEQERDHLIGEHLEYVKKLAHKIFNDLGNPKTLDIDDLVACGSRGLVEAASRFDATRGVAFTTFSYYRIRGAIYDGMRKTGWLPRSMHARISAATNELLENRAQREGAPGRPKPDTEKSAKDIAHTLDDLATVFLTSMDGAVDAALPDHSVPPADEQVHSARSATAVREAMKHLPDRERELLELYYYQDMTLQQAGEKLGASKSWSSRLHARAIRMLSSALGPAYGPL